MHSPTIQSDSVTLQARRNVQKCLKCAHSRSMWLDWKGRFSVNFAQIRAGARCFNKCDEPASLNNSKPEMTMGNVWQVLTLNAQKWRDNDWNRVNCRTKETKTCRVREPFTSMMVSWNMRQSWWQSGRLLLFSHYLLLMPKRRYSKKKSRPYIPDSDSSSDDDRAYRYTKKRRGSSQSRSGSDERMSKRGKFWLICALFMCLF